jgi:2-iminobutanoate/2-iminopropanoate deaminase
MSAKRVIISSVKAPVLGPYNQAIVVDKTMYISGQIGVKPGTAELVPGGIKEQVSLGTSLKAYNIVTSI